MLPDGRARGWVKARDCTKRKAGGGRGGRVVNRSLGREGGAIRKPCLLHTSDAADDLLCVDLGGRRLIKKNMSFDDSARVVLLCRVIL